MGTLLKANYFFPSVLVGSISPGFDLIEALYAKFWCVHAVIIIAWLVPMDHTIQPSKKWISSDQALSNIDIANICALYLLNQQ